LRGAAATWQSPTCIVDHFSIEDCFVPRNDGAAGGSLSAKQLRAIGFPAPGRLVSPRVIARRGSDVAIFDMHCRSLFYRRLLRASQCRGGEWRFDLSPHPGYLQISADVFKIVVTQVCQYPQKKLVPGFAIPAVWCVKSTLCCFIKNNSLYYGLRPGAKKWKIL